MLGRQFQLDKMLDKINEITSMKSFSNPYSCMFLFNLIGHCVGNKIYVDAICIISSNLIDWQLENWPFKHCLSELELTPIFSDNFIDGIL